MTVCTGAAIVAALLSAGTLLRAGSQAAQTGPPKPMADTEPFPITVVASPTLVVISSKGGNKAARSVKISGRTLPLGRRPVKVAIKNDDLPTMTKEITPTEDGAYTYTEFTPLEAGDYDIEVTAPDGKGTASTKVLAIEIEDVDDKLDAVMTDAEKAADDGLAAADKKIGEEPPSPAKQESQKKLDAAKKALADLNAKRPAYTSEVRGLIGAIQANAGLAMAAGPGLDRLSNAMQSAESATERVKQATAAMNGADVGCHQLAVVTEVFKTISALLNIKKVVLDTVIGLAKDVTSDAASNKAKEAGAGPVTAFGAGQLVKNLPEITSASKLAGNAYGIMADLGAFVTDQVFSTYCEQFTGPVNATMAAKFYWPSSGGPQLYWKYDYKVTGRLILYYPKSAKGASIPLNGRIEGYAHSFNTWEDSLTVQFPKLMAGAQQIKRDWPPLEIGAGAAKVASQGDAPLSAYVEGSAGGLAAPNSFLIKVTGVLEKDSLSVLVGEAVSDFRAKHKVGVLILSPLTGGLGPQFTWYDLPFLNAQHLFSRGTKDQAVTMKLVTAGKTITADGTFTNTVEKPKARADYSITLKACNPGC